MEKFPTRRPATERPPSVEREANFEGNESLVTIERARNPVIQDQIINLLYTQETRRHEKLRDEEWEPYMPEGWTGEERFKLLKGKRTGDIIDTESLEAELQKPQPAKEALTKKLNEEIDHVASVTEIEFSAEEPQADRMTTDWEVPWTGEKMTTKQKSIIEAHEKGHRIRPYQDTLRDIFDRGFDPSAVSLTEKEYAILENNWEKGARVEGVGKPSREELRDGYFHTYLFTPAEISERMSQLKNYFGMRGSEPFAAEHLKYAKEHYVTDTNCDNSMRIFLEAVTPETESSFLELINNSGI